MTTPEIDDIDKINEENVYREKTTSKKRNLHRRRRSTHRANGPAPAR